MYVKNEQAVELLDLYNKGDTTEDWEVLTLNLN